MQSMKQDLFLHECDSKEAMKAVASFFGCEEKDVTKVQVTVTLPSEAHKELFIVGAETSHFFLGLQLIGPNHNDGTAYTELGLVMPSPHATLQDLLQMVYSTFNKTFACTLAETDVILCTRTKRFDDSHSCISDHFKSLDVVDIIAVEALSVKVIHRVDRHKKETYYIDCLTSDSVKELKLKFLKVCKADKEDTEGVSDVCLCLTKDDKTLPEDLILKYVQSVPSSRRFASESVYSHLYRVHNSAETETSTLTVSAFFESSGGVMIKVHLKKHNRNEKHLYVASSVSANDLRFKIAKVIHKNPFSFKMFLNGKKIEPNTNLEPILKSAKCNVVVEQQNKIRVHIEAVELPEDQSPQNVFVMLYKYETVSRLKQKLCKKLEIPDYCVDLQRRNLPLPEGESLRSCPLKDGDTVQAVVFRHRVRVQVRLGSDPWVDVVVDNSCTVTVGTLKVFVKNHSETLLSKSKQGSAPHSSQEINIAVLDFTVIFDGRSLHEETTLAEAGVKTNSKILMVPVEKLCFSTAAFGCIPVFFANEDGSIVRRCSAMSNGKKLFFDPQALRAASTVGNGDLADPIIIHRNQPLPSGLRICTDGPFPFSHEGTAKTLRASATVDGSVVEQSQQSTSAVKRSVSKRPFAQTALSAETDGKGDSVVLGNSSKTAGIAEETFQEEVARKKCRQTSLNSSHNKEKNSDQQSQSHTRLDDLKDELVSKSPVSAVSESQKDDSITQQTANDTSLSSQVQGQCQKDSDSQRRHSPTKASQPNELVIPKGKCTDSTGTKQPSSKRHSLGQQFSQICESLSSCTSECETDDAGAQTVLYRKHMRRDADGKLVTEQFVYQKEHISQEIIEHFRTSQSNSVPALQSFLCPAQTTVDTSSSVCLTEDLQPTPGSASLIQEAAFSNISQDIIQRIAVQLGGDGNLLFFSRLGLRAQIYNEMEKRYHDNFSNKNYACLMTWCRSQGSRAKMEKLKSVLEEIERTDIKELVEKLEVKET